MTAEETLALDASMRRKMEQAGVTPTDVKRQLQFKREADPKGLLNPGKMITWDRPDFDYKSVYDYAGMRRPG